MSRNILAPCSLTVFWIIYSCKYFPMPITSLRSAPSQKMASHKSTPLMKGLMPASNRVAPVEDNVWGLIEGRFPFRYDGSVWRLNLAAAGHTVKTDAINSGESETSEADSNRDGPERAVRSKPAAADAASRGHACIVERARTGRSRCRRCGGEIPKGQLRRAPAAARLPAHRARLSP